MNQSFILRDAAVRIRAAAYVERLSLTLPNLWEVVIRPYRYTRTSEQNALMWAMLHEISVQVDWHGQKLIEEEWKDVFTAALKRQKVVPGLDGGFVVLGTSTRRMPVSEMSELIELMSAFGVEHNVRFRDERKAA